MFSMLRFSVDLAYTPIQVNAIIPVGCYMRHTCIYIWVIEGDCKSFCLQIINQNPSAVSHAQRRIRGVPID